MSELPKGWISCKVGDVINVANGYSFKSIDYSKEGFPIVRISDIQGGKINLSHSARIPKSKANYNFKINRGDLLIALSGATTGKVGVFESDEIALQNQRIGNFKIINENILIKGYRNYYISSKRKEIELAAYGGAQPNISGSELEDFDFPLAPLNEQKRITEKLDKLLARVEEAKARLEKIPVIIKRFRQSVLNAAVTGDLTKEWRERNNSFSVNEIFEIPERVPFEIPETWKWVKWINIVSKEKHSFKRGPFGGALKKEIFVNSGYKVYEQCNPINDNCDLGNYYITKEKYEELFSFRVKALDLLISCSGVTLGRITQVPENFKEGIINQALLKVTLAREKISNDYFIKYFRSKPFQTYLFENSQGSAQPNIKGVKELKELPVPLPHPEEQKEIVKRVEALFKTADEIEVRYQKAKAYVDKLTQSILAKAFRGELVPQDPNDEPAEELLERIRVEREKAEEKSNKKKFAKEPIKKRNKALKKLS